MPAMCKIRYHCLSLPIVLLPLISFAAPATFVQSITHDGETVTMRMKLQNLRGANFALWAQNAAGDYDIITPVDERSYLGTVDEYPDAVSCGILQDDGTFRGAIYFDRGVTWRTLGNAVEGTQALNYAADTFTDYNIPGAPSVSAGQAGSTTYGYDIGIDAENGYYTGPGTSSVAKTFELIEYNISLTRAQYMRDALLRPYLGRVIVRTDAAQDPYTAVGGGDYLNTLRTHWNTNHGDANSDLVAGITPGKVGGGLAWVGVVGTSYGYSVNDGGSSGSFDVVFRHEMGHNWGCGHYVGGSPEGTGFMGGNGTGRMSGCEVYLVLDHRDSRISAGGILDAEGTYTAVELPPYASLDAGIFTQTEDLSITVDVLANDHDANAQALSLSSFDNVSARGGTITQQGQNLVYSAQGGYLGVDYFKYVITDTAGQTATGVVVVDVQSNNPLRAYLPLDETSGTTMANEASPSNPGEILNGALVGVSGQFGNAVTLDGDDDSIRLYDLNLNSDTVTLSAWIKRPAESQASYACIIFNDAGLNFGTANELRYHWNNTNWTWNSGLIPPADQWVFVALVIEPTQATIYMHDGTSLQSASNIKAHTAEEFTGTTGIGANPAFSDRDFKGDIDDVRIYRKALDASEIATIIAGGSAGSPAPFDGAWGVTQTDLNWSPAANATQYHVYLGSDETAVRNASIASSEYLGAVTTSSYSAPSLSSRTTYYWRVDTENSSGTITGEVWKFTLNTISDLQITNYSFEDGPGVTGTPTGWTLTGGSNTDLGLGAGGSDGSQLLWIGPGVELTQDLAHTLSEDEILTLEYESSRGANYARSIQLLAKNSGSYQLMAETTEQTGSSSWPTIQLDYTVAAQYAGMELAIRILGDNFNDADADDWNEFDNFRINSSVPPSAPPTWNSAPVTKTAATEDSEYNGSLSTDATDPEGNPLIFAKVSGPDWLQISEDGTLSGTPLTVDIGENTWQVTVTDLLTTPVSGTLSITVTDAPEAPTFTNDPFTASNATKHLAYSASIAGSATDNDEGDTLSYAKTAGPDWLTIAPDGTLSGTPRQSDVGLNTFTVSADDGNLTPATATLNIIVEPMFSLLFSDDFERSAGSTIGNGWIEQSNDSRIYNTSNTATKMVISVSTGTPFSIVQQFTPVYVDGESYRLEWNAARAASANGNLIYDVSIGIWDGGNFTPLSSEAGSFTNLNLSSKKPGPTVNFTATSNETGQAIAIRFEVITGSSDWAGFDDISLFTNTELDSDNDGMINQWELSNGLNPNVDEQASNPDGDSYNNWFEYVTDTDPLDPNSQQSFAIAPEEGTGDPQITFSTSAIRDYIVQYSNDLSPESWLPLTATIKGTGGEITVTDNTGGTKRFYRVKILLP